MLKKLFLQLELAVLSLAISAGSAAAKWEGVDLAIIDKVAKENGRTPMPLVGGDYGDLLLLMFLVAGAGGGFIVGYYFRELFGKGGDKGQGDV